MNILNTLLEHIKVSLDIHINFILDLIVNEALQVVAIIDKLPTPWKEFKNYLKHKRKKISVEDLIVRLSVEEDNKEAEKRSKGNFIINDSNIVVDDPNNSKKCKKESGQQCNPPKKKFKGNYFICGNADHKFMDCRLPKKDKKKDQANIAETKNKVDHVYTMPSKCNLVGNPRDCWIDSSATRHVCANKKLFALYSPTQDDRIFI
ncbi:putative glucan endo-1,3-beta-glucosidase A-like [Capsicum annuum]|nr:putative glucan endo-1,3-beta-glucosidase A-like [Capsicum annuum]